jgi:ATP-dependent RNA helicase DHX36
MKTGKTYIRDATAIGAFPLLLFGGKIKVEHEKFRASCDNWIKFRAAPRVAVLFKSLREELEDVLLRKIADPGLNVVRESEGLVDTIVEVLESEHQQQQQQQQLLLQRSVADDTAVVDDKNE